MCRCLWVTFTLPLVMVCGIATCVKLCRSDPAHKALGGSKGRQLLSWESCCLLAHILEHCIATCRRGMYRTPGPMVDLPLNMCAYRKERRGGWLVADLRAWQQKRESKENHHNRAAATFQGHGAPSHPRGPTASNSGRPVFSGPNETTFRNLDAV